jgi:hypothetical protein
LDGVGSIFFAICRQNPIDIFVSCCDTASTCGGYCGPKRASKIVPKICWIDTVSGSGMFST